MPDKDFDKLFKDSFMDAEIEPSADLWGNIAQQLEPEKKRSLPVMWMAAATVTVVASAMLFTQNGDKVRLHGTTEEIAAVNSTKVIQAVPLAVEDEATTVSTVVLSDAVVSNRSMVRTAVAKVPETKIEDPKEKSFIAMQPSEKDEHLIIKKGEVRPLDVMPTVSTAIENQTMYAQADTKPIDYFEQAEESDSNKKGIRNVGDLINYVVDKVDKRDKKIIKFDTDDDDNSSIIGLNIGFLKLNKKNK